MSSATGELPLSLHSSPCLSAFAVGCSRHSWAWQLPPGSRVLRLPVLFKAKLLLLTQTICDFNIARQLNYSSPTRQQFDGIVSKTMRKTNELLRIFLTLTVCTSLKLFFEGRSAGGGGAEGGFACAEFVHKDRSLFGTRTGAGTEHISAPLADISLNYR